MSNKSKQANKLLADIDKKLCSWNERSCFTLKGVKNLSVSDMETLALYAETIGRQGTYEGHLMQPFGNIEKVLSKYNLIGKDKEIDRW